MTICIAAACIETHKNRKPRIVLCADWRVSSAFGGSDTKLKLRKLPNNWFCLTAGSDSEINAVIPMLGAAFSTSSTIDETNVTALIRSVLNNRKRQKIDELIQGRYGISYDDFLAIGKDKFPADVHREAVLTLSEITLGCSLIVAGFDDNFPILVETTETCRVHIRENFAAIGEGSYLAQSVFLQRTHIDTNPLGETIYVAYEAKKYAENIGSVGEATHLVVISPDSPVLDLPESKMQKLEEAFSEYGPQPLSSEVEKFRKLLVKV